MTRPLALVTGASSGIGRAFAQRLAADGHDLVVVARRGDRLRELASSLDGAEVEVLEADLASDEGIDAVAAVCRDRPLDVLVNDAGVAHYMPLAQLPMQKLREITALKVTAPTVLARAALPGMLERGSGRLIAVSGMIAFAGPAPSSVQPRRAVYGGGLAYLVAFTQTLHAELEGTGVVAHVTCPGIVATEFHSVQGFDASAIPRMSPDDVVTAAFAGMALGETVSAPGVEDGSLLDAVWVADLAAFHGQSVELASRYRTDAAASVDR